jgi:hypothetical protein
MEGASAPFGRRQILMRLKSACLWFLLRLNCRVKMAIGCFTVSLVGLS